MAAHKSKTEKKILFAIRDAGKLGFMDVTGKIVIPAKFQNTDLADVHHEGAVDFSDWVAVMYKSKWGFIDAKGAFKIEPTFGLARPYSEDLAAVGEITRRSYGIASGRWGYIDRKGKLVIPYQFGDADAFSGGQAVVLAPGKDGNLVAHGGQKVIDRTGAYLKKPKPGRCGTSMIDAKGKITIAFEERPADPDALFAVSKDEKHGFEDARGRLVIKHAYDDACDFTEGFGCVKVKNRWGFIDAKGKMVIEPQFLESSHFAEGFAQAKVNVPVRAAGKSKSVTRFGFVNTKGEMAIEPRFTKADERTVFFEHGLAAVVLDKARAYVDRNGKVVWHEKRAK